MYAVSSGGKKARCESEGGRREGGVEWYEELEEGVEAREEGAAGEVQPGMSGAFSSPVKYRLRGGDGTSKPLLNEVIEEAERGLDLVEGTGRPRRDVYVGEPEVKSATSGVPARTRRKK